MENIQKHYSFDKGRGSEVRALRGINLEIKSGEIAAIIGPSGAGKSTLLHLLGLMDRPTSGRIFFDDVDICALSENLRSEARRNKIGFLFQMHYLLPEFTVWENLLIPGWDRFEEKKDKALEILKVLGLSDRMNHIPSELSGGEQQRAALARALINDPCLLLADEPTGNLDRETGEKVEEILFSECDKRKITLLLVTHNPDLAGKADRIIRMKDGAIS